jgi:hypothetical protein
MDHRQNPFNVGFGAVVTGTVSYTVQHSFDGVVWYDHPTIAAQSTNKDGNYAYPVLMLRLTQVSGSGSVVLTIIQAG